MTGARRVLLVSSAVTALLVLVAIVSKAHRPVGGIGGGNLNAPTAVADYLATIALIVVPIGAVLGIFGLVTRRRQAGRSGQMGWHRTMIASGIIVALTSVAVFTVKGPPAKPKLGKGRLPPKPNFDPFPVQPKGAAAKKAPATQAQGGWLPALVVGSLLLGIFVTAGASAVRARRNRPVLEDETELAQALNEMLSDSLDDLRAERDPRKAVIRAYGRMEETFAAYGVPREEHETPLEYVGRVLDSLGVSSHAVRRLVLLFERAKFSPHEIGPSMKDEAIEAVAGLRSELEAGRMQAIRRAEAHDLAEADVNSPGYRRAWVE
jgi:hypothetical protein